MPALAPTAHVATITWLGRNADRDASLASAPLPEMTLGFAGLEGESHAGLTRASDSRVIAQYARGTTIRNTRQLSILSQEELDQIATAMGLERLDPSWLGASMVVAGIPDFSHVPPSARLVGEGAGTAALVVDMENRACMLPAPVIEAQAPGFGVRFKSAAAGRRGITTWVEREGVLRLGTSLRLHVPDQPPWRGALA